MSAKTQFRMGPTVLRVTARTDAIVPPPIIGYQGIIREPLQLGSMRRNLDFCSAVGARVSERQLLGATISRHNDNLWRDVAGRLTGRSGRKRHDRSRVAEWPKLTLLVGSSVGRCYAFDADGLFVAQASIKTMSCRPVSFSSRSTLSTRSCSVSEKCMMTLMDFRVSFAAS